MAQPPPPVVPEDHLPPDMEERYVSQVFYILFFTDFVINMDIGILPACSIKIMNDLNLNNE